VITPVLHVSIFLYLAVYMILFAYSINFSILGGIHDIFLYLAVYVAYVQSVNLSIRMGTIGYG